MIQPQVTVITATTGKPHVVNCIDSVNNQTYSNVKHLIFADGPESAIRLRAFDKSTFAKVPSIIELPYPVGNNQWNGHRMYGAGTFLAPEESDYIIFLDDDNTIDPDHISSLMELIQKKKLDWAFSFRKIVDANGEFICNDDCESLGHWSSVLHEHDKFIDVNCYLMSRNIALAIAPVWYRKFRQQGQMEIDRAISYLLMEKIESNFDTTYKYSVNYKVGNSALSVQKEFFIAGNRAMLEKHNGRLPWKE